MKAQRRPSAGLAGYLDLKPVHATADAGSKGLGARFFGCETRRQAFGDRRLRRQ